MPGRHGWGGRGHGRHLPARRHMEPFLLLLVARKPSYGYELIQELGEMGMPGVAPSLVYRMMRQFEMDDLVLSDWDTDTAAGPARRVYRITADGLMILQDWAEQLEDTVSVLNDFLRAYEQLEHPEK